MVHDELGAGPAEAAEQLDMIEIDRLRPALAKAEAETLRSRLTPRRRAPVVPLPAPDRSSTIAAGNSTESMK